MNIPLHSLLTFLIQGVAFCAGGAAVVLLTPEADRVRLGMLMFGFVVIAASGGLFIARTLLRRWPARCPKCGGAAFATGRKPICYDCAQCGERTVTNLTTNM